MLDQKNLKNHVKIANFCINVAWNKKRIETHLFWVMDIRACRDLMKRTGHGHSHIITDIRGFHP